MKDDMGWACSTRGRGKKFIQNIGRGNCREEATGRIWCRLKDNIRMNLNELGWEDVNCTHLVQNKDQWRALLTR